LIWAEENLAEEADYEEGSLCTADYEEGSLCTVRRFSDPTLAFDGPPAQTLGPCSSAIIVLIHVHRLLWHVFVSLWNDTQTDK
jgi:hypothetical protein